MYVILQKEVAVDPKDFCYWLKGVFEVTNPKTLSEREIGVIKKHLDLVFKCVTDTESVTFKFKDILPDGTCITSGKTFC